MLTPNKPYLRILSVLAACVMFFCLYTVVAFASEQGGASSSEMTREEAQDRINALTAQREQLKKNIKAFEQQIANNQNAAEAARNKKAALEEDAAILEEQITLKLGEITRTEADIEEKHVQIAEKQQEYDKSDRLLQERLVAIYRMNNSSLASTLLNVDSFSSFLTLSDGIQRMGKKDVELLERLTTQREDLEAARVSMEELLAKLDVERASLEAWQAELEQKIAEQTAQYSAAMAQIAADEKKLEDAYKEMQDAQKELETLLAALKDLNMKYVGGDLLWPVPAFNGSSYISSYYGPRTLFGRYDFHNGVDIAGGGKGNVYRSSIVAANDGQVVLVSTSNPYGGYGYYLVIDHGGGIKTLYAHCDEILVKNGDWVVQGKEIAKVGNTGRSTGAHLHFELRLNNKAVDALPYLSGAKSLS